MTQTPASPPGTPPSVDAGASLSPLPRNSLADADSSAQRKRPRLDSGEQAHRSLSVDTTAAQPGTPEPSAPHRSNSPASDPNLPPSSRAPSLLTTPSKMTINVRDASNRILSTSPKSSNQQDTNPTDGASDAISADLVPGKEIPERTPEVEVTSSVTGSPEIEVAEPEDMGDSSHPTVWKRISGTADAAPESSALQPKRSYPGDMLRNMRVIEDLMDALKHKPAAGPSAIEATTAWMLDFIEQTRALQTSWFELCDMDRDLWGAVPVACERARNTDLFASLMKNPRREGQLAEMRCIVEDFVLAFARLAARMFHIDTQTLEANDGDLNVAPDLLSLPYLHVLHNILISGYDSPLLHRLRSPDHNDRLMEDLPQVFLADLPYGIKFVTRSVVLMVGRAAQDNKVFTAFMDFVAVLVIHFGGRNGDNPHGESETDPANSPTKSFFTAVNDKTHRLIEKQNSALTFECLKPLVNSLSQILKHSRNPFTCFAEFIPENFRAASANLPSPERITLLEYAWKMPLLKKCIMNGRMDARVYGVDAMQELLVQAYSFFIKDKDSEEGYSVIVGYLADYIQQNNLPGYLIGVESHPQLIARCRNIIGFLFVSKTYTDRETDIIWNVWTNCQDPRAADALKEMVNGLLDLSSFQHLFYWFQKFIDLPSARFDGRMRQLCNVLANSLSTNGRNEYGVQDDYPQVYQLFLRLLRDSFADNQLPLTQKREVYDFSTNQLREVLQRWPLSDTGRLTFFAQCVREISSSPELASGGITVLLSILTFSTEPDEVLELEHLQTEWGLVNLLVKDLSRFRDSDYDISTSLRQLPRILTNRLLAISKLIMHLPTCFTPELTAEVWLLFVGTRALNNEWRDSAWQHLTKVPVGSGWNPNHCLDEMLSKHFETLEPAHFTPAVLMFAEKVGAYIQRMSTSTRNTTEGSNQLSVGDIYWTISLKAEKAEIASRAIDKLVLHQANVGPATGRGRSKSLSDHSDLIARAIESLIGSATALKESPDDSSAVRDTQEVKLRLRRSLTVLLRFSELAPSKLRSAQASPSTGALKLDFPGDEISIQYQSHSGGKEGRLRQLKLGNLATLKQLSETLSTLTGFPSLKLIVGGEVLDVSSRGSILVSNIPNLTRGLLLVKKIPTIADETVQPLSPREGGLEAEIMKHFFSLYDLLSHNNSLGHDVHAFLGKFPTHEAIVSRLLDPTVPVKELLPIDTRYKTMYSVNALHWMLMRQSENGGPSANLLVRGVCILSEAILALDLSSLDTMMAAALVDCLLNFLKEPVSIEISAQYFDNPEQLVERLAAVSGVALVTGEDALSARLANGAFASILEAFLRDHVLWSHAKSRQTASSLLRFLLLEARHDQIQDTTKRAVQSLLSALELGNDARLEEFRSYFWVTLESNITEAISVGQSAGPFFDLALEVFRTLGETTRAMLPLVTYIRDWSQMLCMYTPPQDLENLFPDPIVSGLAGLLRWCFLSTKSGELFSRENHLTIEQVWRNLLFPHEVNASEVSHPKARLPVMNSMSRGQLYSVILAMCNDLPSLRLTVSLCGTLFARQLESHAWNWGFAQISSEWTTYDENWDIERLSLIRSPVGFAGLKNLSNTCYLNSLLNQLFMNTRFRAFMMSLTVHDPIEQGLLFETQRLLAFQEDTWLHAVDAESFVGAIRTYDNTAIEIHVQMDVDEFYNLLFDRLEGQIPDPQEKAQFRRFYGGQIVQQIKSKDCPHVSERLEPFSAIQCEIKGKTNLLQSLQDYVEGEAMEGDNKYSCTSCGNYVNAVKRACFKDVPDNLILHLKRFDYDLTTGTRSKINDYFEFPPELDMGPYNVEYLKDTSRPHSPDIFSLVGVLVHTGQAEAGHYYSFIKDARQGLRTWFEFNDTEVLPFDEMRIRSDCFGGAQDAQFLQKAWSAYMLFYQRKDSGQERLLEQDRDAGKAVVDAVSNSVRRQIAMENSVFIRKFCTFDSEHASFLKGLLDKFSQFRKTTSCSDDHRLETEVMSTALGHVFQVSARQKQHADVFPIVDTLCQFAEECPECAKIALDWLINDADTLRGLFLRCGHEAVRQRISSMLLILLNIVRFYDVAYYGVSTPSSSQESLHRLTPVRQGAFARLASILGELSLEIPGHLKTWDNFFGLLCELAYLGAAERLLLQTWKLLDHSLKYLVVATLRTFSREWPAFVGFAKICEKRNYPMLKLIQFVTIMLQHAEQHDECESLYDLDTSSRESGAVLALDRDEWLMLNLTYPLSNNREHAKANAVLQTVFRATAADDLRVCSAFVHVLCSSLGMQTKVVNTITSNINTEPGLMLPALLVGARTYVEVCAERDEMSDLLDAAAVDTAYCSPHACAEYLEFFLHLRDLPAPESERNDPMFFKSLLLECTYQFAPHLLTCADQDVRRKTLDLLQKILFEPLASKEMQLDAELVSTFRETCNACTNWIWNQSKRNTSIPEARTTEIGEFLVAYQTQFSPPLGTEGDADPDAVADRDRISDTLAELEKMTTTSPEQMWSAGEFESDEASEFSTM